MADLVLKEFPPSLIARIDRYIELLEELNPGYQWTRSAAIASILARGLAEVEGAEIRATRRKGPPDRRRDPRGEDRRQGLADRREIRNRRKPPYPEMVDLVIDHLLRKSRGIEDETWRDRHRLDEI